MGIGKVRKGRVGWFCFEPLMDGWWLPLSASSGIHCPLPRRNYSLSLVSHSPPPSHSTSHPTLIPFSPLLIPLSSHSHPILLHLVLNPLSSHFPSGSHPILLHLVLIPSQMALGLCVWVISLSLPVSCLVSLSLSLLCLSVCVLCLCPWSSLELFPSRVS